MIMKVKLKKKKQILRNEDRPRCFVPGHSSVKSGCPSSRKRPLLWHLHRHRNRHRWGQNWREKQIWSWYNSFSFLSASPQKRLSVLCQPGQSDTPPYGASHRFRLQAGYRTEKDHLVRSLLTAGVLLPKICWYEWTCVLCCTIRYITIMKGEILWSLITISQLNINPHKKHKITVNFRGTTE